IFVYLGLSVFLQTFMTGPSLINFRFSDTIFYSIKSIFDEMFNFFIKKKKKTFIFLTKIFLIFKFLYKFYFFFIFFFIFFYKKKKKNLDISNKTFLDSTHSLKIFFFFNTFIHIFCNFTN